LVSQRGKRYNERTIQQIVKDGAGEAGIKKVTPHTLRYSFETDLLGKGADISIPAITGHKNLRTAQML